ncbi:MAG TPA: hypothetical protein DCL07_04965, partial [Cryomorphaceae bacterium]|nr:hypothetical protein [Cryomorphaceae bacterium]
MMRTFRFLLSAIVATTAGTLSAQTTAFGDNLNVVTSAMPMLNIGPDARMGGMANAGRSEE